MSRGERVLAYSRVDALLVARLCERLWERAWEAGDVAAADHYARRGQLAREWAGLK